MSDFECFTWLFIIMYRGILMKLFFYMKKKILFLKAFYNNLIAKNRFVIKCM